MYILYTQFIVYNSNSPLVLYPVYLAVCQNVQNGGFCYCFCFIPCFTEEGSLHYYVVSSYGQCIALWSVVLKRQNCTTLWCCNSPNCNLLFCTLLLNQAPPTAKRQAGLFWVFGFYCICLSLCLSVCISCFYSSIYSFITMKFCRYLKVLQTDIWHLNIIQGKVQILQIIA